MLPTMAIWIGKKCGVQGVSLKAPRRCSFFICFKPPSTNEGITKFLILLVPQITPRPVSNKIVLGSCVAYFLSIQFLYSISVDFCAFFSSFFLIVRDTARA